MKIEKIEVIQIETPSRDMRDRLREITVAAA
jgi:hypothetical protein